MNSTIKTINVINDSDDNPTNIDDETIWQRFSH